MGNKIAWSKVAIECFERIFVLGIAVWVAYSAFENEAHYRFTVMMCLIFIAWGVVRKDK